MTIGHQAEALGFQCAHGRSSQLSAVLYARIEYGACEQALQAPHWPFGAAGPATGQLSCAISSSNGTALSVTLALPSTKSVTLFSITIASTSARRWLSLKYQRTTSAGFS